MKENFVKFKSVTQAMKAQQILNKQKIKSNMERSTGKESSGCGYKLVTNGDIKTVKKILIDNNINFE